MESFFIVNDNRHKKFLSSFFEIYRKQSITSAKYLSKIQSFNNRTFDQSFAVRMWVATCCVSNPVPGVEHHEQSVEQRLRSEVFLTFNNPIFF